MPEKKKTLAEIRKHESDDIFNIEQINSCFLNNSTQTLTVILQYCSATKRFNKIMTYV